MALKVEESTTKRMVYAMDPEQVNEAIMSYALDNCDADIPSDAEVYVSSRRNRAQAGSVAWVEKTTTEEDA